MLKPGTVVLVVREKYLFSDIKCYPENYFGRIEKDTKCILLEATEQLFKILLDGKVCYMVNFQENLVFKAIENE